MAYAVRLDSLRAQRVAAGISVSELARRSTTSDAVITTLENGGSCTEEVAVKLATALGISVATAGRAALS